MWTGVVVVVEVVVYQGANMMMIDIEEVKNTEIRKDTTRRENDDDTTDRLTDHRDGVRHLILDQGQDQDMMMIEIDEEIDTSILLHEIITDVERTVLTNDAKTREEEEVVLLAFNLKVHHLKVHHQKKHHQI